MLKLLETLPADSKALSELQRSVQTQEGERPSLAMRRFERIVGWFELRHNGLVYPFINVLLLWDIHCVIALERWQLSCGKVLRGWFLTLGELEALSSLAAFTADNEDYVFPELVDEPVFEAEGLGHPLVDKGKRVNNDVHLPGPGRGLLVTGSNMSGKSTLLRAVGINAVLALSGAPVAARGLRLFPLAVRTSMRISDSLSQGVSHFYAELRTLKSVLDAARGSTPVLFLLDEILHGTNSRERQIGARWVLGELLRLGALGAVSTHDEGLCQLPEPLASQLEQVHFRETMAGDEMNFDYRLRQGPVTSGNALRLMRSMGIPVPLD
jgi:DNA mismatch repair ATPase MutS